MKEIKIDGEIGYDFWSDSGNTGKTVARQLEGIAAGEEIQISINSPGGSVYEGVVIFNLIRDYAKTHPVSVRITGIAMSAASYIALAARTVDKNAKITASDNSVFMIHHPWCLSIGNAEQLKKDSDYLDKLSGIFSSVYSFVTGKKENDIKTAMSEETFYVGKEIFDAGFCNDFEYITATESGTDDSAFMSGAQNLIVNAKLAFDKTIETAKVAKSKNACAYNDELKKAAALFDGNANKNNGAANDCKSFSDNNITGGKMKGEDLLAKDKSCYDEVYAKGAAEALEKERARIAAHIKMGKKVGSLDAACKFIEEGKSFMDEAVQSEYMVLAVDKSRYDARLGDNPEGLNLSGESGGSDSAKIEAAFKHGLLGKTLGGGNE